MKKTTNDMLAKMHPAQINWAKSKALKDVLREDVQALEKANDYGPRWKDASIAYQEAIKLFHEATAALLIFGLEYTRRAHEKHKTPMLKETEELFTQPLSHYILIDFNPDMWGSKVVDLCMRINANDVSMNTSFGLAKQ